MAHDSASLRSRQRELLGQDISEIRYSGPHKTSSAVFIPEPSTCSMSASAMNILASGANSLLEIPAYMILSGNVATSSHVEQLRGNSVSTPVSAYNYASELQVACDSSTAAQCLLANTLHAPTITQASSSIQSDPSIVESKLHFSHSADPAWNQCPNEFVFQWQDGASYSSFQSLLGQEMPTGPDLLQSTDSNLGNGKFGIESSSRPANKDTAFYFNSSPQLASPTFDTQSPLQQAFISPISTVFSPKTSFSSTSASSSSPSTSPSSNASPTHPTPTRHACSFPDCEATFKRPSDMRRHARTHTPGSRMYGCWVQGCDRNGRKGFTRSDKWGDHIKKHFR